MSVNINVLKELHRNPKEEIDIKLKKEKTRPMQVCMYQKGYSESTLQYKSQRAGGNNVGMCFM